ncbi:dTDP-4-dehydrorhamnose reductase [Rhodobacterales bacterium HTCC2150]|jgi:dTDP-4-dehydrorhamnose reductase|nr:dTDP-4-dehydrorhamnose reductase [Rhodobacterales bacterium HTCC2150] [Rhodobacteraceae bacterium HTCC2150]
MSILVFGTTGQVSQELARRREGIIALGRDQADLSDPAACAKLITETDCHAVINAAAYTAVDKAESDEAMAALVNGAAPTAMATACAAKGIPFVHISTDYVFDGTGDQPWMVNDLTAPLGAYGRTKLTGEEGVRAAGGTYGILRTSWVFSAHGNNFVKTMRRLGAERDRLTIVADQIGGPTAAGDIADACLAMADQLLADSGKSGTYHFAGGPDVSWADFAREIFAQSNLTPEVVDIPTSDFPTPAARPANSRMDCSTLETVFGITRLDWRVSLADVIKELSNDEA